VACLVRNHVLHYFLLLNPTLFTNTYYQYRALALLNIIQRPDDPESKAATVKTTEDVLVIRDKFPKAKVHLLVVPRVARIDTPNDLKPEHLPLVEAMYTTAQQVTKEFAIYKSSATIHISNHFVLVVSSAKMRAWSFDMAFTPNQAFGNFICT